MPDQCGDRAVPAEIILQGSEIASWLDYVPTGQDETVRMNDEPAPGTSRPGFHARPIVGHVAGADLPPVGLHG